MQYYKQVRETMFGYKRRTFRGYIDHLESRWCILDCKTTEALKQNWKRDLEEMSTSQDLLTVWTPGKQCY